ncbi:glycosyl hydrolase 108 family protein [Mesorhizobium sp. CO1-1-8]|uniref:glycosyl hydrolase 108 family protein n=1 Tax=Mesorhizobium sp. CO1-1-8 TaxID=2876631 RepID=UPI0021E25993|nr:glycosyl hydrolase 108 family protein [Mesorhizobium sp. CO1-1-8]
MKGVTQRVYDAIAGAKGQAARSVKSLATVELNHIYDKQNWDAVKRRSAARRCRLCRL